MDADNDAIKENQDPVKPATEERYNCPMTGAHFMFDDMCRRLKKLEKTREQEQLLYPKSISKKFMSDVKNMELTNVREQAMSCQLDVPIASQNNI